MIKHAMQERANQHTYSEKMLSEVQKLAYNQERNKYNIHHIYIYSIYIMILISKVHKACIYSKNKKVSESIYGSGWHTLQIEFSSF